MTLVDVRVAVDEAGKHDAAGEIERGRGGGVVRRDRSDLAVGNREVGEDEAVGVGRAERPGVSEACRRARASV